jgi:hypothetical protein
MKKLLIALVSCTILATPAVALACKSKDTDKTVTESSYHCHKKCHEQDQPPVDVCNNIEGNQATAPEGTHVNDKVACVQDETPPVFNVPPVIPTPVTPAVQPVAAPQVAPTVQTVDGPFLGK